MGGVRTGDLLKVHTEIGWFVLHAWVTEGLRPGVVACSHHLGRWRLATDMKVERMTSALVDLTSRGEGRWFLRRREGVAPYASSDPDTMRIWWRDSGVHQNLTFPGPPRSRSAACTLASGRARREGGGPRIAMATSSSIPAGPNAVYLKLEVPFARPAPDRVGFARPLCSPASRDRARKPMS